MIKWDLLQVCQADSIFKNKSMNFHHFNRLKVKNHMLIITDAEKALYKNPVTIYD